MGWTLFTGDSGLIDLPVVLYRIVYRGSAADAAVTLYDGRDTSGRKIVTAYTGGTDSSKSLSLMPGLHCPNGVYLDLGATIDEVLVVWSPLPE